MTALAVTVTVMAAPILLSLFGEAYGASLPIVFVLGIAHLARAAASQAFAFFLLLGRAKTLVAVNAASFALLLVALVVLVPGSHVASGSLGAAIAHGFAMTVRSAALLVLLAWQSKHNRPQPMLRPHFIN